MSIKHIAKLTLIAASLVCIGAQAAPPKPAVQAVAPLGFPIGGDCADIREKFTGSATGSVSFEAGEPDAWYSGATKIAATCNQDNELIMLEITASKGGMGNQATREAYATLSKRYKRVAGAPMPQLGNGYARFVSGNAVIEQVAQHLSFEFTINYYTKQFYDNLIAFNKKFKALNKQIKESAL